MLYLCRWPSPVLQLLRNLWLYCALYGLAGKGASAEQAAAAGRIACWTPVLLLGEAAGSSDADVAERLKVGVLARRGCRVVGSRACILNGMGGHRSTLGGDR